MKNLIGEFEIGKLTPLNFFLLVCIKIAQKWDENGFVP